MGIALEPDFRQTGRPYRWTEIVSPFFLETEELEDMAAYNAASVLLRMGVGIAEADGDPAAKVLAYITTTLDRDFDLTRTQSKRLAQLEYLLLHVQDFDKVVSADMLARLSAQERTLIGTFLLGIAAADLVTTQGGLLALRSAHGRLRLDLKELDLILEPRRVAEKAEAGKGSDDFEKDEFRLDMEAVATIMQETREVSQILSRAMAVNQVVNSDGEGITKELSEQIDVMIPGVKPSTSMSVTESDSKTFPILSGCDQSRFHGLPARFQPFLEAALKRRRWPRNKITDLAREHHLMLAGAVEAINEWSCERHGDWLIEEGEPMTIHCELLESS